MTQFRVPSPSLCAAFALSCAAVLPAITACSDAHARADAAKSAAGTKPLPAPSLLDEPIQPRQVELIDLAIQAATALPLDPHVKTHARLQEEVVAACLTLDQPRRALACADAIPDWRKGAAYADLATYCAEHGETAVQHYLDLALEIADDEDIGQDWRRDRIRSKVARAYIALGRNADAEALTQTVVVDSEGGEARAAQALRVDPADLDEELKALQESATSGNLDQARNGLNACARLFDRFYADASARSRVEEAIKTSWTKLPPLIRIQVLMDLARFAMGHDDPAKALTLVNDGRLILDEFTWTPEDQIGTSAKLAGLRYQAGEPEKARSEVDAAQATFDTQKEKIVDIYRAGVLRALAEAYQTMNDPAAASAVYRKALEEGVHNPNSRPRAEDLSATCCSMAVHGFAPDDATWARMREIYGAFGDPW